MKNKIKINLNYDFDPEQGYTTKSITLDTDTMNIYEVYEDLLRFERTLIINLYPEDIEELLKGTGIEINGRDN